MKRADLEADADVESAFWETNGELLGDAAMDEEFISSAQYFALGLHEYRPHIYVYRANALLTCSKCKGAIQSGERFTARGRFEAGAKLPRHLTCSGCLPVKVKDSIAKP